MARYSSLFLSALLGILLAGVLACGASTPALNEPSSSQAPLAVAPNTEAPTISGPTSTTRPSITPSPSNTPRPTATPTPVPEPIAFSGSGDSVVDFDFEGNPGIVHIVGNAAGRYFGIQSYDINGQTIDLLVNTTDPYDGFRPINWLEYQTATRIQVTAVGSWTIDIIPLAPSSAIDEHTLTVPGTYEGAGDNVVFLVGETPDLASISGNEGGRYFGVIGWNSGSQLLVNTTDPYDGTVILSGATVALEVIATGSWSVAITAR